MPREGHGPTVCAKNRQIKPWAWALLGESQKLVSISLCGGSAAEGGPGGPHTRKDQEAKGKGDATGNPGSDGGAGRELSGPPLQPSCLSQAAARHLTLLTENAPSPALTLVPQTRLQREPRPPGR